MNTEIKPKIQSGMPSLEIKFLVYKKWGTITAAARALHFSRSQLSYCISRRRISEEVREKLAEALDMTVKELFGDSSRDETEKTADESKEEEEADESIDEGKGDGSTEEGKAGEPDPKRRK